MFKDETKKNYQFDLSSQISGKSQGPYSHSNHPEGQLP